MTAVAEIDRPKREIIALVESSPALVLIDKQKYSEFYEAMKAECDAHVPDLSTEKGRKAIASLAHKVARTKTAIDDAGKKLNEEARSRINAIDESRRDIRQQLDTLKADVRKPLTEWEVAEEARETLAAESLKIVREMGRIDIEDTVATVKARIDELAAMTMSPDIHREAIGVANAARADAMTALQSAHERLVREESERAELELLRAEAAERAVQEEARRAEEESERRRAESEKSEAERQARAEAEQKAREESAAKAAEERARIEAEARAREEREVAERAHAEELAAERRRAEDAERAAQAEVSRLKAAEIARGIEEAAAIKAQRERDADRTHRSKVLGAAMRAVMEAGPVDEAIAKSIVLAIAAGSVPNISIRF